MKKLSKFWNRNDTYFRAGSGMCIYTEDNKFLLFERALIPDSWQFPQGGRDKGETFEQTLWRELYEEVNLSSEDFSEVSAFPYLLSYEYKNDARKLDWLGQTHQWYFLKIKPDVVIDLSKASHPEFKQFKLMSKEEVFGSIHPMKKQVYQFLFNHLEEALL